MVFFGSWDRYIYGVNATSGSEVWKQETAYPVESSPTVHGGVVYIGSNDNRFGALPWRRAHSGARQAPRGRGGAL